MRFRHLTLAEVAGELGRSPAWLHDHWRELVATGALPKPVAGGAGAPLAWSAAQVYAVLDRDLPDDIKPAAAAYRAAGAAYLATHADPDADAAIADSRRRLDARLKERT